MENILSFKTHLIQDLIYISTYTVFVKQFTADISTFMLEGAYTVICTVMCGYGITMQTFAAVSLYADCLVD